MVIYSENQLETIWIGLLKVVHDLKTEAAENSTDNIKRFECFLDFLHYIFGKCAIKTFYLQMLKTALKVHNISFGICHISSIY